MLVSQDVLTRMQEAESTMTAQFGLKVTGRTLYLRAREFHLATSRLSYWFDMKSTLEDQLSRYRIFLANVGPAEAKSYVDLRLNGRIVYK
jgi:hypothetical protein